VVTEWKEERVCKVSGVKRKLNAGVEPDDGRYRYFVSYIAGVKVAADGRVLYKVVWKSDKFRAGAPEFEWMSEVQMDDGSNVEEFHQRYNLPRPGVLGFPSDFCWEFDLPLAVKSRADHSVSYRCPHCEYSEVKRSNVDVHIVCKHTKCPGFECVCGNQAGTKSNYLRHFKKCSQAQQLALPSVRNVE